MKPYYEQDGVTIYHGDCAEVMLQWGGPYTTCFDLLLTDPPYGLDKDGQRASKGEHGGRKAYEFMGWDGEPADSGLLMNLVSLAKVSIIWGGNYFGLPASDKWLVWDKGQRINQSDCELAWTNMRGALRVYTLNRVELMKDGAVHPTQKPEQLMRWCIDQAGDPVSVFDPFMGSGSTLVAAKRIGKRAVGIEREERYCEIAARRLAQGVLELTS